MATIHISQFTNPPPSTLQQAVSSLDHTDSVLGTKIQDQQIVQITSASPLAPNSALGSPLTSYTVNFNNPFFGPNNPGSAPVVENVLITFPNSRITPEFRTRVENDFAAFDLLAKKGAKGDIGVAWGWVEESLKHESLGAEEATGFFVVRGWETMGDFENVLATPEYAEAIPLLLAWEAPFEMVSLLVCVERIKLANLYSGTFSGLIRYRYLERIRLRFGLETISDIGVKIHSAFIHMKHYLKFSSVDKN